MMTVIKLDLSGSQITRICDKKFGHPGHMTRKQITAWVEEMVHDYIHEKVNEEPVEQAPETVARQPEDKPGGDRGVRDFVPSRGDEPYLCRPKSPELAAACSAILDGLEVIEEFAWESLERNRQ
jgi:hypothetical protein